MNSPVVPAAVGMELEVARETALRSGSGRFRLGRLGSGGSPPGRGMRPEDGHITRHPFLTRAGFPEQICINLCQYSANITKR